MSKYTCNLSDGKCVCSKASHLMIENKKKEENKNETGVAGVIFELYTVFYSSSNFSMLFFCSSVSQASTHRRVFFA